MLRPFLTILFAVWAGLAAAEGDQRELARISNYLNAIDTLRGRFVQIDPDAVVTEGEFFLRRPGRIRFEYEPPNPTLVVSDGTWVGVTDKRDGLTDRVPLSQTPLHLLLKADIDLRAEGAVKAVERAANQIAVTVHDPKNPDQGEITLIFSDNPLALRQWVATDPQGRATSVALSEMRANVSIPNEMFLVEDGPGPFRR